MNNDLKKYEVLIDNKKYTVHGIWWDYPQTDSESSAPSDDNVLYRDVLPRRVKVGFLFQNLNELEASQILLERKKEQSEVNYYDLETQQRVTRTMFPVSDSVSAKVLFENNTEEEFICGDIELRYTQMVPDEFS